MFIFAIYLRDKCIAGEHMFDILLFVEFIKLPKNDAHAHDRNEKCEQDCEHNGVAFQKQTLFDKFVADTAYRFYKRFVAKLVSDTPNHHVYRFVGAVFVDSVDVVDEIFA